ncbi:hypothetical protein [Bacillus bombysepticus]|uniref:hypothetical protein n=1 Tax=Bacillus bombysepticus TaxID=658666 RepID=UPI003017E59E
MFITLQKQMNGLFELYQETNDIADQLFQLIRDKDYSKADILFKKYLQLSLDIQDSSKVMYGIVSKYCAEIGSEECVMEVLYPLFTVQEQEWFMDAKIQLQKVHDEFVRKYQMNLQLIQANMRRSSILVNVYKQKLQEQQSKGVNSLSRRV